MSGKRHIAILTKGRINPAHGAASDAARRVVTQAGFEARQYAPEIADDVRAQAQVLHTALEHGPAAILMSPVLGPGAAEMAAAIHAARVPLGYFIDPIPSDVRAVISVIGDDHAVGQILAREIARRVEAGRIVVIEGYAEAGTNRLRHAGLEGELDRVGGISVAAVLTGRYQRAPAAAAMAEWLETRDAAPDGVVAFNDVMALGAAEALAARGWHGPILGVNVIPEAVEAMRAGTLAGSVSFDPVPMAALGARALIRHLAGEAVPPRLVLRHRLVTAGTLGDYAMPSDARPLPDWPATGDLPR